jgi:hypothetical protein
MSEPNEQNKEADGEAIRARGVPQRADDWQHYAPSKSTRPFRAIGTVAGPSDSLRR